MTRPGALLRRGINNPRRASGKALVANWKADTLGLANNANVTSWPDTTGTQGAYTATGTALVYKTAQQNSLSVVSASASNGASMQWNTAMSQPFTIMLAMKLNLASQTGTILKFGLATGPYVQVFLTGTGFDMNNGTDMVRWTPDVNFHIFTLFFSGAASLLRVDGVQQGAVGNPGTGGITPGTHASAIAGQSDGFLLGEVAVYSNTATVPTVEEAALRTKWGTA